MIASRPSESGGAAVVNIQQIINETGSHVLIIHHVGHEAKDRARGWSGLEGAVDTSFKVTKPKGVPEITWAMDKDNDPLGGEILPPVVCAIESHPMGKDPWGNDVVAPYLLRAERVDVDFHKMEVKQETKDSVLFMIGDLEETHKRYVNLEGRKNHAPDVFAEFFPDKVADLSPKDIHNLKKEWTAAIVILKDEGRLREVTAGSSGKKRTWLAIVPGTRPPRRADGPRPWDGSSREKAKTAEVRQLTLAAGTCGRSGAG